MKKISIPLISILITTFLFSCKKEEHFPDIVDEYAFEAIVTQIPIDSLRIPVFGVDQNKNRIYWIDDRTKIAITMAQCYRSDIVNYIRKNVVTYDVNVTVNVRIRSNSSKGTAILELSEIIAVR